MDIPRPVPGLVVSYSYVWASEAAKGIEEGRKDRPCALLAMSFQTEGTRVIAIALPITHTPPGDHALAVEIPPRVKKLLGLDDERSWVVVTEYNRFSWPGPDLRPIAGARADTCVYGLLPAKLYELIRQRFLKLYASGGVHAVRRTE